MAFTDRSAHALISIPSPIEVFFNLQRRVAIARKRRQLAELLNKEDHILIDLGITREDVEVALAKHQNPGLYLKSQAARRRVL